MIIAFFIASKVALLTFYFAASLMYSKILQGFIVCHDDYTHCIVAFNFLIKLTDLDYLVILKFFSSIVCNQSRSDTPFKNDTFD